MGPFDHSNGAGFVAPHQGDYSDAIANRKAAVHLLVHEATLGRHVTAKCTVELSGLVFSVLVEGASMAKAGYLAKTTTHARSERAETGLIGRSPTASVSRVRSFTCERG